MKRTARPVECVEVYDERGGITGWVVRTGIVRWQAILLDRGLLANGGDYRSKAEALRALGVKPEKEK